MSRDVVCEDVCLERIVRYCIQTVPPQLFAPSVVKSSEVRKLPFIALILLFCVFTAFPFVPLAVQHVLTLVWTHDIIIQQSAVVRV